MKEKNCKRCSRVGTYSKGLCRSCYKRIKRKTQNESLGVVDRLIAIEGALIDNFNNKISDLETTEQINAIKKSDVRWATA